MRVFPTTYAVDVFVNQNDEITIRQESQDGDGGAYIYIPYDKVDALIAALRKAKQDYRAMGAED